MVVAYLVHLTSHRLNARRWMLVGILTWMHAAVGCQTRDKARLIAVKDGSVHYLAATDDRTLVSAKPSPEIKKSTDQLKTKNAQSPRDLKILVDLAQHHLAMRDLKSAEREARSVLAEDFRNRDAKIVLAHIAYLKGQYENARAILKHLRDEKGQESEIDNLTACLMVAEGDAEGAKKLFEQAIATSPDNVAARMNLGILYLRRLDAKNAQIHFAEAMKRLPDNPDIKMHLGITYALLNQYDKASSLYADSEKLGNKSAILVFNRALLKRRSGDFKGALADLQEYSRSTQMHRVSPEIVQALTDDIKTRQAASKKISDSDIRDMAEQKKTKDRSDERGSGKGSATMMNSMGWMDDEP